MKRSSWASRMGYTAGQWDTARDQAREAIRAAARQGRTITYTDVAAAITEFRVRPHSPVLAHLLGEILEQSWEEEQLTLTAIVVHKYGDMEPGNGYYNMCREVGIPIPGPRFEFWAGQVRAIFEKYGSEQ